MRKRKYCHCLVTCLPHKWSGTAVRKTLCIDNIFLAHKGKHRTNMGMRTLRFWARSLWWEILFWSKFFLYARRFIFCPLSEGRNEFLTHFLFKKYDPNSKAEKENTVESWWNAFTMVLEGKRGGHIAKKRCLSVLIVRKLLNLGDMRMGWLIMTVQKKHFADKNSFAIAEKENTAEAWCDAFSVLWKEARRRHIASTRWICFLLSLLIGGGMNFLAYFFFFLLMTKNNSDHTVFLSIFLLRNYERLMSIFPFEFSLSKSCFLNSQFFIRFAIKEKIL